MALRRIINSSSLKELDTKASLCEQMSWWGRFVNLASQGGWSCKMRIQQVKRKLPSTAREWFSQLPKSIQRDLKELAVAFRKNYCEAHVRQSVKRREKHVRRFITKLKNNRLKTPLQGQRFKSISDLEYILEQDGDVRSREDQDARSTMNRDFRADKIQQGRFKPRFFLVERMSPEPKMRRLVKIAAPADRPQTNMRLTRH
ncbi:hypothetical protein PI125_g21274 [Phytophthora idaei]|nr:hypothetical protein PI125_g21274 [Phytophthora idaei]